MTRSRSGDLGVHVFARTQLKIHLDSKGSHAWGLKMEQVTTRDLERLSGNEWVNDSIINNYGAMIQDAADTRIALARWSPENAPSVHVFSTFFYAKLENPGYEKAKLNRWTKRLDLFSKDLILIPINHANEHWTCAAINLRKKQIEAYDSLGNSTAPRVIRVSPVCLRSSAGKINRRVLVLCPVVTRILVSRAPREIWDAVRF